MDFEARAFLGDDCAATTSRLTQSIAKDDPKAICGLDVAIDSNHYGSFL